MFFIFSDFVGTIESDAEMSAGKSHNVDVFFAADDALVFEVLHGAECSIGVGEHVLEHPCVVSKLKLLIQ